MTLSAKIAGIKINIVQIPDVIETMESWIKSKETGKYIVIANADTAVLSRENIKIREAVNSSDLSVPDGFSLVKLARAKGYDALEKRVYGPDLMRIFFKETQDKGYSHFFYGSTERTLGALQKNLKQDFCSLKIAGTYSPPFRELTPKEEERVLRLINNSTADVLWVGLGCPKQELWMHKFCSRLKIPVIVGTGAAFEFLAKTKPQAPKWLRERGFEWLFRLVTEPRRLWKRYLVNGIKFVYYITKDALQANFKKLRPPAK